LSPRLTGGGREHLGRWSGRWSPPPRRRVVSCDCPSLRDAFTSPHRRAACRNASRRLRGLSLGVASRRRERDDPARAGSRAPGLREVQVRRVRAAAILRVQRHPARQRLQAEQRADDDDDGTRWRLGDLPDGRCRVVTDSPFWGRIKAQFNSDVCFGRHRPRERGGEDSHRLTCPTIGGRGSRRE
jgi:hypothetical protein